MALLPRALFLLAGLGLLGCTTDSDTRATPRQMCEALVGECGNMSVARLDECAAIGRRGIADEQHEDQCYVFYDGCIADCRLWALWGPELDGGSADGGVRASDGGSSPSDASD